MDSARYKIGLELEVKN